MRPETQATLPALFHRPSDFSADRKNLDDAMQLLFAIALSFWQASNNRSECT